MLDRGQRNEVCDRRIVINEGEAETSGIFSDATRSLGAFDCLKKILTAEVSYPSGELPRAVSSQADTHSRAEQLRVFFGQHAPARVCSVRGQHLTRRGVNMDDPESRRLLLVDHGDHTLARRKKVVCRVMCLGRTNIAWHLRRNRTAS